jgi:hypothetical protein
MQTSNPLPIPPPWKMRAGGMLEGEGRWLKVHFAAMQLQQLNFFGFEKCS